ncbi:MAG: extracellular solute-binding protein, partial [Limnochordia bacterium]|nr:extracellular solute-binding protein [Limnochordia bacterium]
PGMPVFRTIEVDGQVIFDELRDVPFPHTGMNIYDNLILGGEEPYYIYFDEGRHTLAVKVTAAPLDQIYSRLSEIIGEMNAVTLQIKKLTGQNSDVTSNIDTNRTWNVLQYMPTILEDIEKWQSELLDMYKALATTSGIDPTFANDLMLAVQNLERLKEEPRTLPNKISLLGDDASSAAQLLGTLLPKLAGQELSLDRIYIYDGETELPSAHEKFWDRFRRGGQAFFHSFTPVMNESASHGQGTLTVWVNKSSQYVEVLRELTAQNFTPKTGIDVSFSIMPKEDKLILSNASGTNPDVVVGLSAHYPFDFGVRGIAKNLLEYGDFLEWYSAEYNLESLVPFSFDGGIYAAPDTNEFRVLFYRKDILEMLGLEVPQTMDDVRAMMPTLHRNAMNFSLPLSTDREGYKGFQQTMPFVYQKGGNPYAADGLSAALTDPQTAAGLRDMVDLYTIYGLQSNVRSFFNSFRSGVIPLGISSYETYLQLQTMAPELADLWDIALAPGERNQNGEILHYQAAVDTATIILANTNMAQEAYTFMKWWLSSKTQLDYANHLQLKYGPDYKWNTANLVAFSEMGLPSKHKEVILTMWRDWQKETPRHVASYMLEREISNLWGSVVRDNMPFMPTLDGAQKNTDREMERKLREFGFLDENGSVLRAYPIGTAREFELLLLQEEGEQ